MQLLLCVLSTLTTDPLNSFSGISSTGFSLQSNIEVWLYSFWEVALSFLFIFIVFLWFFLCNWRSIYWYYLWYLWSWRCASRQSGIPAPSEDDHTLCAGQTRELESVCVTPEICEVVLFCSQYGRGLVTLVDVVTTSNFLWTRVTLPVPVSSTQMHELHEETYILCSVIMGSP